MKTIWIVDGAYLLKTTTVHFDYLKLKRLLEEKIRDTMTEGYYLNSVIHSTLDAQGAFLDWLQAPSPKGPELQLKLYSLHKELRICDRCGEQYEFKLQKGVDVGIATLIIRLAIEGRYDRLVLCAGDGDFEDALIFVKDVLHKEICICGFRHSLSTDLQSYADQVIWLNEYISEIQREGARW